MSQPAPPGPAAPRNRRAHQRYALVGHAASLHVNDQAFPCTVRNLSGAGLMAGCYVADLPTGRGEMAFATGARVAGTVLWTKDWSFGFAFDETLDAEHLIATLDAVAIATERRADLRITIDCAAKLRVRNRFYFGRVVDISSAGARFETPGHLKQHGDSMLIVPDLPPLPSDIRWARDGAFGLAFRERVPDEALAAWLHDRRV